MAGLRERQDVTVHVVDRYRRGLHGQRVLGDKASRLVLCSCRLADNGCVLVPSGPSHFILTTTPNRIIQGLNKE